MSGKRKAQGRGWIWRLVAFLWLGLVAFASVVAMSPPSEEAVRSGSTRFDVDTALARVQPWLKEPHPVGSAAHLQIREGLLEELRQLGLEPEVQQATATVTLPPGTLVSGARVANIVARIPGRQSERALLLSAHYDSVASSPGAADDGIGLAVLLEAVARLQAAGEPPAQDVVVLFTDGEERGGLGMQAFLAEHPLAERVAFVLNFEARGTNGAALMFEVGPRALGYVGRLAALDSPPWASSWMVDVYERMPHLTDFTFTRGRGLPGLNFAIIEGAHRYHTSLDTLEYVDRDSVAHFGVQAVGLVEAFARDGLPEGAAGDAVFFNLPGIFVVYGADLARLFAFLPLALFLVAFALGLKRGVLSFSAFFRGVLFASLAPVAAWYVARWSSNELMERFSDYGDFLIPVPHGAPFLSVGLTLLGLAGGLLAMKLVFGWRPHVPSFWLGATLPLQAASAATAWGWPSASGLFLWPALGVAAGVAVAMVRARLSAFSSDREISLIAALGATPSLLLFVPTAVLAHHALGLELVAVLAVIATVVAAVVLPIFIEGRLDIPWRAFFAVAALGLSFLVFGRLRFPYDQEHPRPSHLVLLYDHGRSAGEWTTFTDPQEPWLASLFEAKSQRCRIRELTFVTRSRAGHCAPAGEIALPAPKIELVDNKSEGDRRTLKLRLRSARSAPVIWLGIEQAERVRRAEVDGKEIVLPNEGFVAVSMAGTEGELEVELELEDVAPFEIVVLDQAYDIAELSAPSLGPRPEDSFVVPEGLLQESSFSRRPIEL